MERRGRVGRDIILTYAGGTSSTQYRIVVTESDVSTENVIEIRRSNSNEKHKQDKVLGSFLGIDPADLLTWKY